MAVVANSLEYKNHWWPDLQNVLDQSWGRYRQLIVEAAVAQLQEALEVGVPWYLVTGNLVVWLGAEIQQGVTGDLRRSKIWSRPSTKLRRPAKTWTEFRRLWCSAPGTWPEKRPFRWNSVSVCYYGKGLKMSSLTFTSVYTCVYRRHIVQAKDAVRSESKNIDNSSIFELMCLRKEAREQLESWRKLEVELAAACVAWQLCQTKLHKTTHPIPSPRRTKD